MNKLHPLGVVHFKIFLQNFQKFSPVLKYTSAHAAATSNDRVSLLNPICRLFRSV